MALIQAWLGDYVAEGYLDEQDSYVLGPARVSFTQTTVAESITLVSGSATMSVSATVTPVAGITTGQIVGIVTAFSASGTAVNTASATISVSVDSAQTTIARNTCQSPLTMSVESSQTTTAQHFLGSAIPVSTSFSVSVTATNQIAAQQTISGVLQASVLARANLAGDIDAAAAFASSISGARIVSGITIEMPGAFTQVTPSINYKSGVISASVSSDQTTTASNTSQTSIALDNTFTETVEGRYTVMVYGDPTCSATFSQSTSGTNFITLAGERDDYTWNSLGNGWDNWPYLRWGFTGTRNLPMLSGTTIGTTFVYKNAAVSIASTVDQSTLAGLVLKSQPTFANEFSITPHGGFALESTVACDVAVAFTPVAAVAQVAAADFSLFFTNIAFGIRAVFASGSWSTEFTQDLTTFVQQGGTVPLSAEFAAAIQYNITKRGEINIDAEISQTLRGGLLHSTAVVASLFDFDQSAVAAVTTGETITIEVVATESMTGLNLAQARANLAGDFAIQAIDTSVQQSGEIDWSAFVSDVTIGDIRSPDPYRRLIVPTEDRILRVLPETRILTIESESRVLYVPVPAWNQARTRRVA